MLPLLAGDLKSRSPVSHPGVQVSRPGVQASRPGVQVLERAGRRKIVFRNFIS